MYAHDHTRIVIATARNAARSHPEDLQVMINMDSSSAAPTRNDARPVRFVIKIIQLRKSPDRQRVAIG